MGTIPVQGPKNGAEHRGLGYVAAWIHGPLPGGQPWGKRSLCIYLQMLMRMFISCSRNFRNNTSSQGAVTMAVSCNLCKQPVSRSLPLPGLEGWKHRLHRPTCCKRKWLQHPKFALSLRFCGRRARVLVVQILGLEL